MQRNTVILLTIILALGGAVGCGGDDDGGDNDSSSDVGTEVTDDSTSSASTEVSDQLDEFCDLGEEYLAALDALPDPDNPTPEESDDLAVIGTPAVDLMNTINASGELTPEDQQRLDDCLLYFDGEQP